MKSSVYPSFSFHNYQFVASIVLSILPHTTHSLSCYSKASLRWHIISFLNVLVYIAKRHGIFFLNNKKITITPKKVKNSSLMS